MKISLAKKFITILICMVAVALTCQACNFPGTNAVTASETATLMPTASNPPTATPMPTVSNPPTATATPQSTPTPTTISATASPSQTATITHLATPGTPPATNAFLYDSNSSLTASLHRPQGGDYFSINLYERPFNANTQDTYYPQLDILQSSMVNGSPWIYGSITLQGTDPSTNQLDGSYALELDLNLDGRGDVLIVANQPAQGEWSTNGVQVFEDPDHDVGGSTPLHPDVGTPGDGYEQKVFDSGIGNDPDLAWSMVSSSMPNVVWFAFKADLINNAAKWMWGAWAQMGGLHPELFDYNDHFSLAQAGYPFQGNTNYPIKALAELDNTCRWVVGFSPNGSEPGICALPATPTPTPSYTPVISETPTITKTPKNTNTPKPTRTPTPKKDN